MDYADIQKLADRIADALNELTYNADAFDAPHLHIYLDDEMTYRAELVEGCEYDNADAYFSAADLMTEDNEPDTEKCYDVANIFIFIEH